MLGAAALDKRDIEEIRQFGTTNGRPQFLSKAAVCRYKINSDFDSWQGYLTARYKFGNAISSAINPTIYTGDSHK